MGKFFIKYRSGIIVVAAFLLVRILVLVTFWQASQNKGGWNNFYNWAQSAPQVLLGKFHEICDWHPPLYYTFTSSILFLFKSQWFIYFFQLLLSLVTLWLVYKITRLFFSHKVSYIIALIIAVEPFWAWHNWLLVSENLFIPLLLAGFYLFFRFIKIGLSRNLNLAALFFGLATLTRLNSLFLTVFLSFLVMLLYILRFRLQLSFLPNVGWKRLVSDLFIFNLIFFAVLTPWFIRNKIVYDRFTFANIVSTNYYYYNLPPLIALQKNISYNEALKSVENRAQESLGKNVGSQGNCQVFTKEEFNRQLDFYGDEAKKEILANFVPYLKIHLIKAIPYFFQSGYFDMYSAYSGEYSKPDITSAILKGDLNGIMQFFSAINLKLIIYLFEVAFWGLSSLAVFLAPIYAYFKDKEKFIFFIVGAAVIIFSALLTSPFVLVRYRLPNYIFFFISLVYILNVIISAIKNHEQKIIKKDN